jgi:hypothetical protein
MRDIAASRSMALNFTGITDERDQDESAHHAAARHAYRSGKPGMGLKRGRLSTRSSQARMWG